MTVAPCLHLKFRMKAGIMYLIKRDDLFFRDWTLIESDDLFLEITIRILGAKNLKSIFPYFLVSGPPFCTATTAKKQCLSK